ncbi:hypothetical protein HDZ31DRAFT_62511 [Schizophyllum fasciatum]
MRTVITRRRGPGRHSSIAQGLTNARSSVSENGHNPRQVVNAGYGQADADAQAGAAVSQDPAACNGNCGTAVTGEAPSATAQASVTPSRSPVVTYVPAGGQATFTRASTSATTEVVTSTSAQVDSPIYFSSSESPDVEASVTFSVAPTSSSPSSSTPPTLTAISSAQSHKVATAVSNSPVLSSPSSPSSSTTSGAQTPVTTATAAKSTTSNTAALAGGLIGGFVGLALLILLVLFVRRRQQRPKDDKLAPSQAFMREQSLYVANGASFARIDSRDGSGSVRAPTPAWMGPRAKTPESARTFLNLD